MAQEKLLYTNFSSFLRERFQAPVEKISIDAGFSCPHRGIDRAHKGCIFCDERGSGSGAYARGISIREQVSCAIAARKKRNKNAKFIVYFQAFTNTYGLLPELRARYDEALAHEDIVGLSIGTRPDCVSERVLDLIASYTSRYMVWLELGLQSAHDKTLRRIRRGHCAKDFFDAVPRAAQRGILVCAHAIIGLPGETRLMTMQTAQRLAQARIDGIKFHPFMILRGTEAETLFRAKKIRALSAHTYCARVCDCLERLPARVVVQRLSSDESEPERLIAPRWVLKKNAVLAGIAAELTRRKSFQGKTCTP